MAQAERGNRSSGFDRHLDTGIVLLLGASALAYFDRTLHLTLELRDEGFLFYHIARVADGEIPHRDFIEVYGPGVYALTAPIFALFDERIWPVRVLLALFRAGAVMLTYGIARHFASRAYALFAAALSLAFWGWSIWSLTTPYAALFTIPLCMFSLYLLLVGQSRGRPAAIVASGFSCGLALLFKWSLAAMSAYGMGVAICAGALLASRRSDSPEAGGVANGAGTASPEASRSSSGIAARGAILLLWAIIAGLVVVPFASTLSGVDYLLHIGPIHAVQLLVAIAFARSGDAARALRAALPRLLQYAAGFVVLPLVTIAIYAAWGKLGDLFYNTVTRPLHYQNYYMPVKLPPLASLALFAGVAALVTSALALLGRSFRLAGGAALAALACAPLALRAVDTFGGIAPGLERLLLQLPALTAWATVSVLAVDLARGRDHAMPFLPILTALLFQQMMSFQIYPRGSYNATLMLGTLAPVVAYLASRWSTLATATEPAAEGPRRCAAVATFALVAVLPALFVADKVTYAVTAPQPDDLPEQHFRHPVLAGIHPKEFAWEHQQLQAFDDLVGVLETLEPSDAKLFVLHNEPMLYLTSEREPLFEDEMLLFFLAGWDLLPADDRDAPSLDEIAARLDANPDTILVARAGEKSTANLYRHFPGLRRYISRHYAADGRVGPYVILRRDEDR